MKRSARAAFRTNGRSQSIKSTGLSSPSHELGCANPAARLQPSVPVAFYEAFIRPTFAARRAMVYVLPEVKPAQQVFGSYDVAAAHGLLSN